MLARSKFRQAFVSAPRALVLAFSAAIALGGLLLASPFASADGAWHLGIDRLFVATSAACVTGLDPIGVGAALSPAGLALLAVLVQLGGIGIMTAGTIFFVVLGRSLSVTEERSVSASLGEVRSGDMRRILLGTMRYTLFWEAAGAIVFFVRMRALFPEKGDAFAAAGGAFFAVMSFCNAGFSLFSDSFAPFLRDPASMLCAIALSLVGGIGFVVHANLLALRPWRRDRLRRGRLTLHSRLVLEGILAVLALDMAMFLALEWNGAYAGLGARDTVVAGLFQAITTRSAGFAAVPVRSLCPASLAFTILMMFIGAAPGSTGGGLKTTTVAILGATVAAMFASRETPELHGRSIPRRIVNDALAILVLSLGIVLLGSFLLYLIERPDDARAPALLFETVSAFANNGMSMADTTAGLSAPSKLVITLCMFAGRLGPVTLVLLLHRPGSADLSKRYPEENVIVG